MFSQIKSPHGGLRKIKISHKIIKSVKTIHLKHEKQSKTLKP